MKQALFWGFIVGITSLLWLYLSFWLGLHTSGMGHFAVFMLGWLIINIVCYILALRSIKKSIPAEDWSFYRGLKLAGVVAGIAAVFAVIAQVGYWKVVHPEWGNYLVEQTRIFYEGKGLSESELAAQIEKARAAATLPNYAVQSAASDFLLGIILSSIILLIMRKR